MISHKKKAVLHIAQDHAGFDDETYRDFLFKHAGVRSSNDLTEATFDKVMRAFESETRFVSTAKQARRDRRKRQPKALRTDLQLQLITALYNVRGWRETSRQTGFNKRCCGLAWPQTRTHAQKIIEGSKAEGLHYIARLEARLMETQGHFSREGFDLTEPADIIKYTEHLHAQLTTVGSHFSDLQERPVRRARGKELWLS